MSNTCIIAQTYHNYMHQDTVGRRHHFFNILLETLDLTGSVHLYVLTITDLNELKSVK